MSSAHTPGPWVAAHRTAGIEHDVRGLERISIGQPCRGSLTQFEETVCWIIPDVFGSAEHEANARLIAAAPTMLKALQKVAALYDPDREPARDLGLRMEMMEELHSEVVEAIWLTEVEEEE